MVFCKYCGTKLEDGVLFCKNCGTKVEIVTKVPQDAAKAHSMNQQKETSKRLPSISFAIILSVFLPIVATVFLATMFSMFSGKINLFVGNNSFQQIGLWKLTGHQLFATNLEADMVIDTVKKKSFSGYIDWSGYIDLLLFKDSVYGREYFSGRFDNDTNKIFFHGIKLEGDNNLSLGTYEAYFDKEKIYFTMEFHLMVERGKQHL